MPYRTDLIYRYDGSFLGLLTCVFESFDQKELPLRILSFDNEETFLYPEKEITTDQERAERVLRSIPKKISENALHHVKRGYLSCEPDKETLILHYLHIGFRVGKKIDRMLTDDVVARLTKAVSYVGREAHLQLEFLRFSDRGGVLTAVIEPKNWVLPIVAPHFKIRLPNENFIIYDKTHHLAYLYQNHKETLLTVDELSFPPANEEEKAFRRLWKRYYDTIGIEGRYNPKCRMNHMPKWYWKHITEMMAEWDDEEETPTPLDSPNVVALSEVVEV